MTQTVLTNKLIDRSSPIPAYQQIANDISKRIAQREWKINDKLPSEQELAQNYGVSRVTIRQAMAQLERDGLIEKVSGKRSICKKQSALSYSGSFLSLSGSCSYGGKSNYQPDYSGGRNTTANF